MVATRRIGLQTVCTTTTTALFARIVAAVVCSAQNEKVCLSLASVAEIWPQSRGVMENSRSVSKRCQCEAFESRKWTLCWAHASELCIFRLRRGHAFRCHREVGAEAKDWQPEEEAVCSRWILVFILPFWRIISSGKGAPKANKRPNELQLSGPTC